MSDYSTAELVEWFKGLMIWFDGTNPYRGEKGIDTKAYPNAIIDRLRDADSMEYNLKTCADIVLKQLAKLKKADALCEDVKHGIEITDDERIARPFRKAIADYEGGK